MTTVSTNSTILAATCEIYEMLLELYPTIVNPQEYFADLALSIAKAESAGIVTDLQTLEAFRDIDHSGQNAQVDVTSHQTLPVDVGLSPNVK